MNYAVLLLCTVWYRLMRKRYRLELRKAQRTIRHARLHLENDFLSRHSSIDRGYLLPEQASSIALLHRSDRYCDGLIERYFA